jgi:hypothetical protein
MTLTAEQTKWAEQHVGEESVLSGAVSSWKELEDGTVEFTVTFIAKPPPSEADIARSEQDRVAAEKEQAAAAEQARVDAEKRAAADAEVDRERIKAIVHEVLAEDGAATADTAKPGG